MKLRIHASSLRIRLDEEEIHDLLEAGRLEEALRFGPGEENRLVYALEAVEEPAGLTAGFAEDRLRVLVPRALLGRLVAGTQDTIEGTQPAGGGETLHVLVEKDYRA